MITQAINLNLIPGQVLPRINVSQYDKGSRTLVFNIYNGSVLFSIPEDATVNIQGTKPDYTSFQYSCMHSGSVATVNLQEQMATVAGEVNCELTISQTVEGVVTLLGTCNFIINVEASAVSDDTVISETDLPLIQQAIQAATEAQASATSAAASAAEAESWSANPPYIGANGNWFVYDIENETFVDSGMPSRGEQGETGATPDITMTAAVDTSVGTPSIVISKTGTSTSPFFHLNFSGLKGETGSTPNISMTASVNTSVGTPSIVITKEGTEEDPIFDLEFSNLKGETGEAGPQGETGPAGATGNGIASVAKTSTSGLVDTYTITFTDGTTTTFTVTNGQDGQGAGDMTKAIYDALNAVADAGGIPSYVAAQIAAIPSVPVMTGATSLADGAIGQVPKPMAGEEDYVLHGDGTWRAGGGGGTNIVPIPEAGSGTYTYDGTEQTYTFASIDSTYINITGNKQTAAGTYTITCSLKSSSDIWTDMTKADKTFTWTINKATVTIPVAASQSYTYDGTLQTFAFTTTLDNTIISVTENQKTNAGSYTVNCALVDSNNYEWEDNTITAKTYAWTIAKFQCTISVSPSSVTLDADNLTATLTVTTTGVGTVSYSGYDSTLITMSDNVITATQETGTTTIAVAITPGENDSQNYIGASTSVSVNAAFSPPEGATVTPTDDIQTWLACAEITDKSYTTVAEVLADSTTLLALMSDSNAVDYLVRSTTWASAITADSTAMTDIGANNYCANTLLADSTWLNAICNSTYFENVLNVKVPTMTSNTTPSGAVSGSQNVNGYLPWNAFTDVVNNGYASENNGYIQYQFNNSMCIKKVYTKFSANANYTPSSYVVSGSNDGSNFTPIKTISVQQIANAENNEPINNSINYSYIRVTFGTSIQSSINLQRVQFYGRA